MKRGHENVEGYNTRDVNLLFVKLHLLDPTQVFPVYDSLRKGKHQWAGQKMTNGFVRTGKIWS